MSEHVMLTTADLCDKCGAPAKVLTVLRSMGRLQWCGHHWNEVENDLLPLAIEIHDERDDPDA